LNKLISFNFSKSNKNDKNEKIEKGEKNDKKTEKVVQNDKTDKTDKYTQKSAAVSKVNSTQTNSKASNTNIEIKHNYLKQDPNISLSEKEKLEQVAKHLLKANNIKTQEEADLFAKEIRNPLKDTLAKDLFELKYRSDYSERIQNYYDFYNYNITLNNVDKFIMDKREQLQDIDPRYQALRKIDKVPLDNELKTEFEKNVDQRVNYLSEDFMKKQNRIDINYNYNFEQHKEYTKMFREVQKEDKEKQNKDMKFLKYVKENQEKHNVKNRFMKNLVVPIEKIPNFPVDISDYAPKVTRASRRNYDSKKYNLTLEGYDCWRCYDRNMFFTNPANHNCLNVKLSPLKLLKTFGIPDFKVSDWTTGQYMFEDMNLDMFLVMDWKTTQLSHGLNFTDEFYNVIYIIYNIYLGTL